MKLLAGQFSRFLVAGTLVGILGIVFLQGMLWLFGAERLWAQAAAVAMAYFLGGLLNYYLQQVFVFDHRARGGALSFALFFAMSVSLSLVVGVLSAALLAWPAIPQSLGRLAPATTFALACLAVSPLSFGLTRLLVMGPSRFKS